MEQRKSFTEQLRDLHQEMELRVAGSTRDQLVQCARLLAMYVAMYKCRFGEVPADDYRALTEGDSDEGPGAKVFAVGLAEMNEMLQLVEEAQSPRNGIWPRSHTIN
jgi:hypothetical protein